MSTPSACNFVEENAVHRGGDFNVDFKWRDGRDTVPLEGYQAHMQIRVRPGGTLVKDCEDFISIQADAVVLNIPAAEMQDIAPGSYVYDIILRNDDSEETVVLVFGQIEIKQEVTEL